MPTLDALKADIDAGQTATCTEELPDGTTTVYTVSLHDLWPGYLLNIRSGNTVMAETPLHQWYELQEGICKFLPDGWTLVPQPLKEKEKEYPTWEH